MNTTDLVCTICERKSDVGIHLVTSFICCSCEQEMVTTDVMDDRYPFFVDRMKHIFYEKKNA